MPDPRLEQEVQLLHNRVCCAVADPKRVLMLYALEKGPLCVNEVVREMGLPQPAVSRHLRVLRERGLVSTEQRGPAVYYTLTDHRVIEALDLLRAVLAAQLSREQSFAAPPARRLTAERRGGRQVKRPGSGHTTKQGR